MTWSIIGAALVLGTCTMSITYTLFYVLGTWSLSYGVSTLGFTQQQYLGMQMITRCSSSPGSSWSAA